MEKVKKIILPLAFNNTPCKGEPGYEEYMEKERSRPPYQFREGSDDRLCGADMWYETASEIVRTPKTIMVPVEHDLIYLLDGIEPKGFQDLIARLDKACAEVGYPAFLRTAYTSGKHGWKDTCGGVTGPDKIARAVCNIVEYSNMGFPEQPTHLFMVREMIPTQKMFTAFADMPITREFRFFIDKDEVTHVQPYWPEHAVASSVREDMPWAEELRAASVLTRDEYDYLSAETAKVGLALPDQQWSVDWLQAADGSWFMIDMAIAARSFKWEPDFEVVEHKCVFKP